MSVPPLLPPPVCPRNALSDNFIYALQMQPENREPLLRPWTSRAVTVATLCVAALIVVLLDLLLADDLMQLSIRVSLALQKFDLYVVSVIFSFVVLAVGFVLFFLNVFLAPHKRRIFPMLFGFMVCLWFHGLAKLLYMDARPSFLSPDLRNDGPFCVAEFGKPSGHALFSFYIFLCLGKFAELRFFRGHSLKIALAFLANVAVAVIICLTRSYFGVHSLNQLVLGSFFGWLIYFTVGLLQKPLKNYLYDPIFEPTTPSQRKAGIVAMTEVFVVLGGALLLAFLRARYILASDDSFFDSIINCVQVKDNFLDRFTLGMALNGLHFVLFNAWFVGLVFSRIDPAHGLQFWYDKNVKWFAVRVAGYCAPGLLALPLQMLMFGHPATEMIMEVLVLGGVGSFVGVFGLTILDKLGVPIKKPDSVETNKTLESIEMNGSGPFNK